MTTVLGGNLSPEASIGCIPYSIGEHPKSIDRSVALADAVANGDTFEVCIFQKLYEGNLT